MQKYYYLLIIKNVLLPFLSFMKMKYIVFRWFCAGMLACCSVMQVMGQLTSVFASPDADHKVATLYEYDNKKRDTIFVYNQTKTGELSLQLADSFQLTKPNTFKWYRFDYSTREFVLFDEVEGEMETSKKTLEQGGYKVTVITNEEIAPRDSFVAWLYMNPGFEFRLYKDDNGEVIWNYTNCYYTDFRLASKTVPDTFKYYHPVSLTQERLINKITFIMKPENDVAMEMSLNTQSYQYIRDNSPPYEDTKYHFTASDMFGIDEEDDIMYRTIIPHVKNITAVLPEKDPTSAPVPVKYTYEPYNVAEYLWRFGDGDSTVYNFDRPAPDTVRHTYYTPRTQGYKAELTVISEWNCIYTTESESITVAPPSLDVPNVFTPNNDGMNDYFKPATTSLRGFEIWIYTRTGKQVYYYRGNDLRDWQGWDGRIQNSGKEADEGVYFFTIKALGWDEPPTKNPKAGPYSGSFHLYR